MNRLVATLVLLAIASGAEAQYPSRYNSGARTTSPVGQLPLSDRSGSSALPPGDPCTASITTVGSNHNYEWNTAKTQVDLTQHPGASANIPLYFRSGPLGSGSKVMFDVRGYVTVTRQ